MASSKLQSWMHLLETLHAATTKADITEYFHIVIYSRVMTFNRRTTLVQYKDTNGWVSQSAIKNIFKLQLSKSIFFLCYGGVISFHSE